MRTNIGAARFPRPVITTSTLSLTLQLTTHCGLNSKSSQSLECRTEQALAADSPVRDFFGKLRGRTAEAQRWLLIPAQEFKTVATHVSTALRKHYLGRHEATRIHRIHSAGNFVPTRYAVGVRYVCLTGPTLFSRKCGLQTKSTALRTHPQHTAGGLFFDQLSAYCTVRFVLPDDKRTISDVAVVGVRVGDCGLYCNGDTRGGSGGHQRDPSLSLARSNSRCRRGRAWRRYCLSLE